MKPVTDHHVVESPTLKQFMNSEKNHVVGGGAREIWIFPDQWGIQSPFPSKHATSALQTSIG